VFVFSGVAKLAALEGFADLVVDYHILPYSLSRLYGYLLPGVEVAVGVFLITGLFLRTNAFIAIMTTISFLIAKSVSLYRGEHFSCGCFGKTVVTMTSMTIALDVLLLALAFQILFHRGEFLSLGPWPSQKAVEREDSDRM